MDADPLRRLLVATFKPDYDAPTEAGKHIASPLPLGPQDRRVSCPRCGSPYVATVDPGEPVADPVTLEVLPATQSSQAKSSTLRDPLAGFTCVAGDCKYAGPIAGA